jgi:hypothetical protein
MDGRGKRSVDEGGGGGGRNSNKVREICGFTRVFLLSTGLSSVATTGPQTFCSRPAYVGSNDFLQQA